MDAGKTLDDLIALPAQPQPSWVHEVTRVGPIDAGSAITNTSDLRESLIDVKQGPIYLLCFTREPLRKIGVVGPIAVGN